MKKHLEIALSQLGVEEQPRGGNWGNDIAKYLHSVGIDFPASWCMAFVYWCMEESYKEGNPLFRTGGVMMQWNKTPLVNRSKTPEIGDIFIMDFGKGLGHTGFVYDIIGEHIMTIEGNSNDEGSREGYEVCIRSRKISTCKGFIKV